MATIRHRESKSSWLRVLTAAVLLLGFGLTAAGPGGVANAARGGHGGHSGGGSRGASFSHREGSATFHMGSRSRSFGSRTEGRRTGFNSFRRSTSVPGLSSFSSSLHMRGLSNLGRMDYRPLDTRTLIGPRPVHEPQAHVTSPLRIRRGDDFPGVIGSRYSRNFPAVVGSRHFGREGYRDRDDYVRFGNDRYFDFGRYDHYRNHYRFDRNDYARFHTYGFYSYRCPTIASYDTYVFPDTFLFGNWFGSNVGWWSGNVCPSAGVTVVLVF